MRSIAIFPLRGLRAAARFRALVVGIVLATICGPATAAERIDLSGRWAFEMDPGDIGVGEGWPADRVLGGSIELPGSLQSQGHGEVPTRGGAWTTNLGASMLADPRFELYTGDEAFGNPFWLTPERLYVGVAWYAREIEIPSDWSGRHVELVLERAHWGTTVFLNGEPVGPQQTALGTPHVHDLTAAIREAGGPGRHTLAIRVDNRMIVDVGKDAHAVGDQLNSNWNGVVGAIELRSSPMVRLDDIRVDPDVADRSIDVVVTVANATGERGSGELSVEVGSRDGRPFTREPFTRTISWDPSASTEIAFTISLGEDAPLWSEFEPNVLRLDATLGEHRFTTSFGLREITTRTDETGTVFLVNGERVFLRGTLDSAVFPDTGYPAMDTESWKEIFRTFQAYGLNHVRFHSWCPPRAAFHAADQLGIYLLAECSTWPNFKYAPGLPEWLEAEGDRMLREYGNHPSFVLMGVGNEFWDGNKLNDGAPMIEPAIDRWRAEDTRRYYTTGAGWPQAPANDFHITQDPRLQLYPGLRLTDPPRTDLDYGAFTAENDVPIITHEIGQWCAYPDLSSATRNARFLSARNLAMFEDGLERAGLAHLAPAFTEASGRFQTLLYKAEIEAALRTSGLAGFQLLGIADYPGHGVAPVGVLDLALHSKGYCAPAEYQRFCADRVLLSRLPRRVYEQGDELGFDLELANYGGGPTNSAVDWSVRGSESGRIASGAEPVRADAGGISPVGAIRVPLPSGGPAEKFTISASIRGTTVSNEWAVWSYPVADEAEGTPAGVRVARSVDAETAAALEDGESVVVLAPPAWVDADTFGSFRPIFWNTVLFTTQREHTLGAIIDSDHPALAGFPSESHVEWQWWDVLFNSKPIPLGGLSAPVEPIVRPIDDWVDPRSLGLIFEARVGSGRLLVCAVDLETDLDERPAARALRASLLGYAASDRFDPQQRIEVWEILRLFREPSAMQQLGAAITASNAHPGYGPELALDGDPATFWHTAWAPSRAEPPHSLEIDLGRPRSVTGLRYTPRGDGPNGRFKSYRVEISDAGYDWTEVAIGEWANDATVKESEWPQSSARYVRFTMLESVNGQPYASAAEVEVLVGADR